MSTYSGDAAEQVVRMSLEGTEMAIKLAGAGAKKLAVLLYAVYKDQKKTKGKVRLTNMLRSGKALKVFAVKDEDLARFRAEAKKYGVLYTVLKDRDAGDGLTDLMVRAEDASKINRIFERFKLAGVDMGTVQSEIEQSRNQRVEAGKVAAEPNMSPKDKIDEFLNAVLKSSDKNAKEQQGKNPGEGRTSQSHPSEPSSKTKSTTARDDSYSEREKQKPSVKKELQEIRQSQKKEAEAAKTRQTYNKHKAPKKKGKSKEAR